MNISGIAATAATIASMVAFGCVVWWAYHRGRKADFAQAAQLPLLDDEVRK